MRGSGAVLVEVEFKFEVKVAYFGVERIVCTSIVDNLKCWALIFAVVCVDVEKFKLGLYLT